MILVSNRRVFSQLMPPGIVAEIGVQWGEHAQIILYNCAVTKLFLIDCWELRPDSSDPTNSVNLSEAYEHVKELFASESKVEIIKSYSTDAAQRFPDEYFDWVYIDADHTLEAVAKDLVTWWPKIKFGGFLCGHDYIDPKYGKKYDYIQVKEAVDAFGKPLFALTNEKYGSWAIKK